VFFEHENYTVFNRLPIFGFSSQRPKCEHIFFNAILTNFKENLLISSKRERQPFTMLLAPAIQWCVPT
jgi:hypothetical protein